jgi:hypothetical protein
MKKKDKKPYKTKVLTEEGKIIEFEWEEFRNTIHNSPKRSYGDYTWNNKKKKWIKNKI